MSYGFASNLRDSLPKASCIGFTGTPIEKTDANTRAVFGSFRKAYVTPGAAGAKDRFLTTCSFRVVRGWPISAALEGLGITFDD